MTPLAKLHLRREKIISRNCDDDFLKALQLEVSDDAEEHDTRGMTYILRDTAVFLFIYELNSLLSRLPRK